MTVLALDRDRLLRDLRAAAEEAWAPDPYQPTRDAGHLAGMARAWRVAAAAIEDGDYDTRSEHRWPCVKFYVTAPDRLECTCGVDR